MLLQVEFRFLEICSGKIFKPNLIEFDEVAEKFYLNQGYYDVR